MVTPTATLRPSVGRWTVLSGRKRGSSQVHHLSFSISFAIPTFPIGLRRFMARLLPGRSHPSSGSGHSYHCLRPGLLLRSLSCGGILPRPGLQARSLLCFAKCSPHPSSQIGPRDLSTSRLLPLLHPRIPTASQSSSPPRPSPEFPTWAILPPALH